VGQAAHEGGAGKHDEAGDEDTATAEQVGHAASQEQEAAVGQDVPVDDPLQALLGEAEVALDRGECDVEDRCVEDVHELDETEQDQDGHASPRRQRRGVSRLRGGRGSRIGLCGHDRGLLSSCVSDAKTPGDTET
jgi:hypothetical protein